jgi:hypothetical protein
MDKIRILFGEIKSVGTVTTIAKDLACGEMPKFLTKN